MQGGSTSGASIFAFDGLIVPLARFYLSEKKEIIVSIVELSHHAIFPGYRSTIRFTCIGVHRPPRAVFTPRSDKPRAIAA